MLTSTSADRRRLPGGRSLHLLLVAFAVSSVGDWLYNVALLALVYDRTRSATWVALTTAARVLPMVVLGPFGGGLADRHNRRGLLIGSDLSRAVLMVGLAAVATAGLPIVLVPVLAAVAVAAGVVAPPSVAACTARLASVDELQRATALRSAIGQGAMVAGPAIGAMVLLATSPSVAILVNALTFVGSAIAVLAIGSDPAFVPARAAPAPSLLADIRTGAQALRGEPSAVRLIAGDLLCSAVYGLLTVTLVLVSRRVGAGDGGYGILLGALGVGGVVGASVAGRVAAPSRWRGLLSIALLLVGLALAGLGAIPTLAGAAVLAAVCGGGMVVGEVLSDTALPQLLDDDVLARAWGLVLPISIAGIVAGSLIADPLVALLGVQGALTAAGLGVLLVAWRLLPRRMRRDGCLAAVRQIGRQHAANVPPPIRRLPDVLSRAFSDDRRLSRCASSRVATHYQKEPVMSKPQLMIVRARRLTVLALTALCVSAGVGALPASAAADTLYVSTGGSDSVLCSQSQPCASVSHAVSVAAAGDTIEVGAGTFADHVTVTPAVSPLTIQGAGMHATTVTGGFVTSGSVFTVQAGATATIDDLSITGGQATNGGGIDDEGTATLQRDNVAFNSASSQGGGIYQPLLGSCGAALTISDSAIISNQAGEDGGGVYGCVVMLTRDLIYANVITSTSGASSNDYGGGVLMKSGSLADDTITGNQIVDPNTLGEGGGAYVLDTAQLRSDTIAGNTAAVGGGLYNASFPGINVQGTIVAANSAENCVVDQPEDQGYNLEDDAGASCGFSSGQHDLVGVDPMLAPLADNGGPTETMALKPGSPAIGAETGSACLAVDQRGFSRNASARGSCDIGAYDTGGSFTLTVAKAGSGSGSVSSGDGGIGCGATCSDSYTSGTQVTLTATPASGSAFAGWSGGGCSGAGACTVTMSSDQSVTAAFSIMVAPPTCSGDSASTAFDSAATVTFSCTGTGVSYSLLSGQGPAHGTVGAISGDQVTYTPDAGFSGKDSFEVQATDATGQTANDAVTVTVSLPAVTPGPPTATITIPANGATFTQGQAVNASYTCAEGANGPGLKSGTVGCSGTVPDGLPVNTSTLGAHTFNVTAISTDGRTATQTSAYTVVAAAKLADVQAAITGPSRATDGSTFAETIRVTNAGPAAATSVITGLVAPRGLTLVSAGGGGKLGSAIYWIARSIAPKASITYTATFKVASGAQGSALIAVASASTQVRDPDYRNNTAATMVTLGPITGHPSRFPLHIKSRAGTERNPLALGERIITRLEHRTLGSARPRHRHA